MSIHRGDDRAVIITRDEVPFVAAALSAFLIDNEERWEDIPEEHRPPFQSMREVATRFLETTFDLPPGAPIPGMN